MDLFLVNRYDDSINKKDPTNEQKILEKLQKNIEEKRKKKKKITKQPEEEVQLEQVEDVAEIEPELAEVAPIVENGVKDEKKDSSKLTGYTVLGNDTFESRKKVSMVLPPWLATPTLLSSDLSDIKAVKDLTYLNKTMKGTLKRMRVESLFPVQHQVVPFILHAHSRPPPFHPRDICVSAPTGSGKTLAFAIPIVQLLQNRVEQKIRALVILPVQELAAQVAKVFKDLCYHTKLSCALLSTTTKLSAEQKQIIDEIDGKFYPKVDIIVTTAGRLVEHIHATKGFSLKDLRFLVIDEADRVMQEIQNDWLYHINKHVQDESAIIMGRTIPLNLHAIWSETSRHPHKLLFSATLTPDPEILNTLNLFQPKLFTASMDFQLKSTTKNRDDDTAATGEGNDDDFIANYVIPNELTQKYCFTDMKYRPLALYTIIRENNWRKFLCFTNNKQSSHRLSFLLQSLFGDDMLIEELSSEISAKQRRVVLDKFMAGKIQGIVCSDALARGIDIPDVEVVISYDPAYKLPTYIHRIGRTARAGKSGIAITILTSDESDNFIRMVSSIKQSKIEELSYSHNFTDEQLQAYNVATQDLKTALFQEKQINYLKSGSNTKSTKLKKSTEEEPDNLFAKLQSALPETETIVTKTDVQRAKLKRKLNIPAAWNHAVNGADEDMSKSKKRKKAKQKKLAEKMINSNVQ